jgi:hypothetical protein
MADVTDTYYPSEGLQGYGTQLLVAVDGDADTEATVAIAEVTTITPGSIDTEDVVRTHLRSPDAHHEHMPGIRDSGAFELVGTLRLDHESQNNSPGPPGGLIYLQRTRAIRNFAIVLPDEAATTLPVRGYVQRFQLGALGVTGLMNFTAAIMPTESYSADLPGMAATGATAGSPGSFTPSGASLPADLAALNAASVTATPSSAWTTGQHVVLGDDSHAHWDGSAPWVVGDAP